MCAAFGQSNFGLTQAPKPAFGAPPSASPFGAVRFFSALGDVQGGDPRRANSPHALCVKYITSHLLAPTRRFSAFDLADAAAQSLKFDTPSCVGNASPFGSTTATGIFGQASAATFGAAPAFGAAAMVEKPTRCVGSPVTANIW
eukprot:610302-Prorocentrum_minimum.AAC.2